jgi:hypothetical protein
MPMTANIIHTAKQTVKASVLTIATDHCLRARAATAPAGFAATCVTVFLLVGGGPRPRSARTVDPAPRRKLTGIKSRRRLTLQRARRYPGVSRRRGVDVPSVGQACATLATGAARGHAARARRA